jgi:c-di-GMP-binding flagellar brake protein YcgR
MIYPVERRRFNRIKISLPLKYHGCRPDTDAPFQGQGVLQDISLGGTYFYVDPVTSFQPGQILSLTIFPPLPYLKDIGISHLQALGEVVRFKPPGPQHSKASVALNFLDSPKIE